MVHEPAAAEDGHLQLARREVGEHLLLPCCVGITDLERLRVVHDLIVQADVVRLGHAGVLAVEAVDLFEMRVCDLADVLADLDLRDDVAVCILDGRELVHAAEHRLAARGDEPLAHTEAVDLRALALMRWSQQNLHG